MTAVIATLNHFPLFAQLWPLFVTASAIYLVGLGALLLLEPKLAGTFLKGHGTSPPRNALEAGLRMVAGMAFMGASSRMAMGEAFFVFGAILVGSAGLMFVLFDAHRRYAARAVPLALRAAPFMGVVSGAAGVGVMLALN